MKIAFTLAYNGTHFLGSQTQKETKNTILGNVEAVLKQLGIHKRVVASGRTDKGVHATAQVCHVELPEFWSDLDKLKHVMNEMLPNAVSVQRLNAVDEKFHARYSAKRRVYRYLIRTKKPNPFEYDFVTFIENVDLKNIQKKIQLFEGEHNFRQFMKTGSDITSTTRIIYKAFAYQHHDIIVLNFEANGFLRSQIRLMVGALLQLDSQQIQEQLTCVQTHKIKPAPPNGLYLAKIKY